MHQTMQGTLPPPVFTSRQLLLASTAKPVTPFDGLVSLIEFFNSLKLAEVLGRLMPFTYANHLFYPAGADVAGFCALHHRRGAAAGSHRLVACGPGSPRDAGWSKRRRFVVIRELEREAKSAVGRRLIEVLGYTYRMLLRAAPWHSPATQAAFG